MHRPLPTVEIIAATGAERRRHPGAVETVDSARLAALTALSVKDALRTVGRERLAGGGPPLGTGTPDTRAHVSRGRAVAPQRLTVTWS